MKKIPYISSSALEKLQNSIDLNLERYANGDFLDLANDARWQSTLDIEYDEGLLTQLEHDPEKAIFENDRINSEIIGNVFRKLTPQLACREEVWVRLSHVECLEYSRKRWLDGKPMDKLGASVNLHMFAPGRPGRRNNHAISRLWWTYFLAKKARPHDPASALEVITQSIDLRKLFFDHPWMIGRAAITSAMVDILETTPEIATEKNRRAFVKNLNFAGGGKVFEVMSNDEIRATMNSCVAKALN